MDLSIIIVNFETFELTKQSINSIMDKNHEFNFEIIVVDNCSKDNSYNQLNSTFKKEIEKGIIKFIANDRNDGFAVANNVGIKIAKGDFILLLNSDTEIKNQAIGNTLDYIKKNTDVGAIGCKVTLSDGTLDKACKRSFPEPKNSFSKMYSNHFLLCCAVQYYLILLTFFNKKQQNHGNHTQTAANQVDIIEAGNFDDHFAGFGCIVDSEHINGLEKTH